MPSARPLRDLSLAFALAAFFTFAWAWRDWANLSALRLPDTDDAVRLQQIRDWLAGQPFAEVAQARLGVGAPLAMHWSRLPDLVPGGLIAGLTPAIGRHAAELTAVILWPALLFASALALIGRIARVMHAPVATALLVAGLAFPASALFLPGRIDHHGLQLVLLLALVAAMLAPRGIASGAGIALAGVASFAIGLEMAPFLALASALVVLGWIAGRDGAERQLMTLGLALLAALLLARLTLATDGWTYPAADGFTRIAWHAALLAAAALSALWAIGNGARSSRARLIAAAALGAATLAVVFWLIPVDPYAAVDPVLRRDWLARVGEAQPLLAVPAATALGQGGLLVAGLVAGALALRRTRDPGWAILWLFQFGALAITLWQVRGAAAGALLAAPALAWAIGRARARGALALAGAWLASAGILYPLAGAALFPARGATASPMCSDPASLAALASLPPGRVAAPIDLGAWGLAATPQRFLAAPYHRNAAGNRAARALLAGDTRAASAADYLVVCGPPPDWLARGAPGWLRPRLRHGALTVYRIVPGDGLPRRAGAS